MKYLLRTCFLGLLICCFLGTGVRAVSAGPHMTISPASKNVAVGDTFIVILGIDTLTEKTIGIDIYTMFDAAKLEIMSVKKIADSSYGFSNIDPTITATGSLSMALAIGSGSNSDAMVVKGNLIEVIFKAKLAGSASFNYTCSADSFSDANIFSAMSTDLIDCAANTSGSYTISSSLGGTTDPTPTPSPSSSTGTTTGSSSGTATPTSTPKTTILPKTGVETPLMLLFGMGFLSLFSALVIRRI